MDSTAAPAPRTATDAELLDALDRGIAAGDYVEVTPDLLATWEAELVAEEAAEAAAAAPRPYAVVLADLVRFGEMSARRSAAGLPRIPELDAYAAQLGAEAAAALAADR
jgi:hypothetical protein